MQISAGDQAAGVLKVQDESKFQGRRLFPGKEISGGHKDGRPMIRGNVVSVTRTVFAMAGRAMQWSSVTRWDGSPR